MAVLAFVLAFLLLGFGAFFLAMSGGPRAARKKVQSRRGGRGATLLFVLTILLLGIAVPAVVIATDKNRNSIPEANVSELTDLQKKGQELFGQRCRNCHTLKAGNATAKVGPTLDEPPRNKALVLDAIANGRAAGNGNMPAAVFEGEDAEAVAEFVAVASGGDLEDAPAEEEPAEQEPGE
jgi:mono/diheme cytochrome c family protein